MKKISLCFIFFYTFVFAQMSTPEFYDRQMNILRNLDIHPSFISDLVFIQTQQDLKSKHTQSLINSMQNFSQLTFMIRKILAQEELPEEILYLAMVESGLKTHSVSNAKAVGVWQFMQATAKDLGLRIDAYVDERRDPVKSTYAAINYLKILKEEFGKWYLAFLAYNCGNAKLKQAIKQAKSDDLSVLLDPDKKYLSLETRNFIRKILTFAFLANDRDFLLDEDASLINYALSNEFIKVDIPSSVSLREIARKLNMDFSKFKKYNPQFKHDFTPPGKGYYIYIPINKVAFFNQNFKVDKLSKVDTSIPMTRIYIVKSGDSLYKIAKNYNIDIDTIRQLNQITKNHLSVNQKLIIPIKENVNAKKNNYAKVVSR
ncbi:transglycosylase SLT domain-containing protein [Campylobacter hepaticus]|uniref:LysM peptidoglycan-binding domain-containing protein n=1 Tax=Campylobacter hepaticus TaxID=1813019 RepID=A0A6A7JRU8_9BACT|nr:lytic transglycosylase domain-containing protein [Campylobacter hepaticus]AXP08754.1 LysM peptidoglycan-binding domain-containing protein [Campylobacter hepaticus]MCZ0772604.1 transglycosylase SLT domain-containing protein [Campylobacter hepaticus]MCZ0774072.1 transglycosylase SLT domain-containing protein [Campylobacter hepaticus]MCZ0775324.1 transglycosylase SLT domain-containing protein [Campylobacter hepaticus]MDX2323036.1 transglycosylase SLT domain-containing protein [Campylobacter he